MITFGQIQVLEIISVFLERWLALLAPIKILLATDLGFPNVLKGGGELKQIKL